MFIIDRHEVLRRAATTASVPGSPTVIGPTDGLSVTLQTIGVRFMIPGVDSDARLSLVEHPMPPRGLAAPLHRHNREDEYSFVLEGRMGALLGDDVVEAGPGDLVYKPRGQWHTFWNPGDEPTRILEIISPAGFELFFAEFAPLTSGRAPDPEAVGELLARYALDMRPETVPELCSRFGLWFPGVNA
jgi:mannose-6-phosphate isomerase-like protein (cupin superfamily)